MKAEQILHQIKSQFRELLQQHPEEKDKSTGFVHDNLDLHHIIAALHMHKNNGMNLNAYNLHDLILNYDKYQTLAELTPDDMVVVDIGDIPPGSFNPKHLISFFNQKATTSHE